MIESSKKIKYHILFPIMEKTWNILFPKAAKKLPDTPIIFIVGSGRNGSTLLASILNQHPDFYCPPEQYALPYGHMKWVFDREPSWEKKAQKWVLQLANNNQNWDFPDEVQKQVLERIYQLPKDRQNIANAYVETLEILAEIAGKKPKAFGDQSPLSTFFSELMLKMYPNARFVFLNRDPRDVALSYKKLEGHPAQDSAYAAKKWVEAMRQSEAISKSAPFLKVQYEDLVTHPKETFSEIAEFAGLSPFEFSFDGSSPAAAGTQSLAHHGNLSKPISAKSVGQWKEKLSKEDIQTVERITRKYL
ncbi:MAG: hypothetical protein SchgKO_14270 [Schleiferiaceae bacterium]